jgi:hypothetical protein
MDRQERIDAYTRNEMSEAERKSFEADLAKDRLLANDYLMTRHIASALGERCDRKNRMSVWRQEILRESAWYRNWKYLAAISSGVAACFAISLFVIKPHPSTINDLDTDGIVSMDIEVGDGNMIQRLSEVDSIENVYIDRLSHYHSIEEMTFRESKEKSAIENKLYEIRWEKINLLVHLSREEEARHILSLYINEPGKYQTQAKELWDNLNK